MATVYAAFQGLTNTVPGWNREYTKRESRTFLSAFVQHVLDDNTCVELEPVANSLPELPHNICSIVDLYQQSMVLKPYNVEKVIDTYHRMSVIGFEGDCGKISDDWTEEQSDQYLVTIDQMIRSFDYDTIIHPKWRRVSMTNRSKETLNYQCQYKIQPGWTTDFGEYPEGISLRRLCELTYSMRRWRTTADLGYARKLIHNPFTFREFIEELRVKKVTHQATTVHFQLSSVFDGSVSIKSLPHTHSAESCKAFVVCE